MRFPIDKHIPKGQHITKAELTLTADYVAGTLVEIHTRRSLPSGASASAISIA